MQRGLSVARRLVTGTPLEQPAKRAGAYVEQLRLPAKAKKNRRDDEALRRLIRSLPDDANCVDVGANVGDILQAMVEGCPLGQHIAFEPVPALRADLAARFPQVDVRGEGLAASPGHTTFTVVPALPSRSGISGTLDLTIDADVEEISINVTTLDAALPPGYRPALVKVDVEGGELEVLQGAQRVLRVARPLLALEHQYGRRVAPERTSAIYRLLDACGYSLQTISGVRLDLGLFLAAVGDGTEWNFLAQPR